MDLRFRSAPERALMQLSHGLRRGGAIALRVGWISGAAGIALFLFPYFGLPLVVTGIVSTFVGAAAALAGSLLRAPLAWLRSRRLRRGSAGVVTLRGRVRALRTVRAPRGHDVVAYRVRFTRGGRGPEIERAEPFLLDDGQPEPALIDVESLFLAGPLVPLEMAARSLPVEGLDLLPSVSAPIRYEELTLAPGDWVEATGWIEEEVDPTLSTMFRRAPVRRVLRGRDGAPLLVTISGDTV
jgi:hypothetical protein